MKKKHDNLLRVLMKTFNLFLPWNTEQIVGNDAFGQVIFTIYIFFGC